MIEKLVERRQGDTKKQTVSDDQFFKQAGINYRKVT